jgi:hypothetical protein
MEECNHNFVATDEGIRKTDREVAEQSVICSICKATAIEEWLYYRTVDSAGNVLHSTE